VTIGLAPQWAEELQAAWLIGPSVHPQEAHQLENDADAEQGVASSAIDPVRGISVEPEAALERGLHGRYRDPDYYFCGKGCKLEFDEDPEKYLAPSYVPSM